MAVNIITKEDLTEFRFQLLDDLKNILHTKPVKQKQWLKSSEVRKLLKISPGTLQNLRINGTLTFTRIGSIIYYNYDDIEALLDANKIEPRQIALFNNKQISSRRNNDSTSLLPREKVAEGRMRSGGGL